MLHFVSMSLHVGSYSWHAEEQAGKWKNCSGRGSEVHEYHCLKGDDQSTSKNPKFSIFSAMIWQSAVVVVIECEDMNIGVKVI